MEHYPTSLNQPAVPTKLSERRKKPRIYENFFARVRGVDVRGKEFEEYTLLNNISASGLSMQLKQRLERGARLFIVSQLLISPLEDDTSTRIALRGVVQRLEPLPGDTYGVAVKFTSYRFLSKSSRSNFL